MTAPAQRLPKGPVWEQAKAEKNWLVYRLEDGLRPGKHGKVPTIDGVKPADRANAATMTYYEAHKKMEVFNAFSSAENGEPGSCGLGYFPRPGAAMRAYDFDDCIDDNRQFTPEVAEIIALNETYTEVSISGCGIRMWAAPVGDGLDDKGTEKNGFGASGVDGKFFTFIGDALEGSTSGIKPAPETRRRILKKTGGPKKIEGDAWTGPVEEIDEAATDARLNELLAQGGTFAKRWAGDKHGMKDLTRSGLDFAVIGGLAREEFSFSEVVHVMLEHYEQPSQAVESWLEGSERTMRRCYERTRLISAEEDFPPVSQDYIDVIEAQGAPEHTTTVPPDRTGGKIKITIGVDLRERDVEWLVDDLLPVNGLGTLYGRPGSFKSFVALYVAIMVANNRRVFGRTVQAGPVVYVAAEGAFGLTKRRDALTKLHDLNWQNIGFVDHSLDLRSNISDADKLISAVAELGWKPALIVIDTLARTFGGGDENSSKDMGAFINIMDRIRVKTGATVLVVHHSGKDASKGGRGHSSLFAAVDAEFEAKKISSVPEEDGGAGVGRLHVTKQKDGIDGYDIDYALEKVVLRSSAESDFGTSGERPRSSLAVRPLKEGESAGLRRKDLTQDLRDLLEIIRSLAAEGRTIPKKLIIDTALDEEWSKAGSGEVKPATRRTQVSRACDALKDAGYLDKTESGDFALAPLAHAGDLTAGVAE